MEQSSPENLISEILQDPRLPGHLFSDSETVVARLAAYCGLWEKWNAKTSLTSETEMGLFIRNHLFVSFQFARALGDFCGLVDIGSGAGLPGIPLKTLYPNKPVLMVECRRKRANFIRQVVRELSLEKAEVFDAKVESISTAPFTIDTAVFRAVSGTAACLQMAAGILESGGRVVLLRTPQEDLMESSDPGYFLKEKIDVEDYYGNVLTLVVYQKR